MNQRDERLLAELSKIREEIRALREAFEAQGVHEELDKRISEIEVEQRLQAIQDEITGANREPEKKRRWFGR